MQNQTEGEYQEIAARALNEVFINLDPFDSPFSNVIKNRMVLYPFRYVIKEPWANPFKSALTALGESSFYISMINRPPADEQVGAYHWYVDIEEFDTYQEDFGMYASAMYSLGGEWGILSSYEGFAVAGGPDVFIQNLKASVDSYKSRVIDFLNDWAINHQEYNSDISWIPDMLNHIIGPEKAEKYISISNIGHLLT